MQEFLPDNDAFLARFASAVEQFTESAGWWARLTGQRSRDESGFDVKKLGTFPIVHGVRSLALQAHVSALNTAERLRSPVEARRLDADLARDLVESLYVLMGLKLKNNLTQRQQAQPMNNLARMSTLGTLDRDQLKEAMAII
jgi:CBS domain-containing protein